MTDSLPLLTLLFGGTALATGVLVPPLQALCRVAGWVDAPGGRKIHQTQVPLAGGLAMAGGAIVSLFAAWLWFTTTATQPPTTAGWEQVARDGRGLVLGAGALAMLLLGWWDDWRELRAGPKFLGQALVAGATIWFGIGPLFPSAHNLANMCGAVLWILVVTNALNFLDNMNGLCAGIAGVAAGGFLWKSLQVHALGEAALAALTLGMAVGFLPWNFPRSRIFLGDSGSHLLGYLLAVLGLWPDRTGERPPMPELVLSSLLFLAVPWVDLLWVVGHRTWNRRPFYLGDTNHLSHQLVRRGLSPARAVLLLCGAELVAAAIGCLIGSAR